MAHHLTGAGGTRSSAENGGRLWLVLAGRWAMLPVGVVVLVVVVTWTLFVGPAIDRASRTTELPGIASAIAIRAAPDGRLVITEASDGSAANGRVLVLDPVSGRSEVVLDHLAYPRDADMSPGGIVCATLGPYPPDPSQLRCTDGRAVALVLPEARADLKTIWAGDVVSDGGPGWYVADVANDALLHVGATGDVSMLPTTWQLRYFPNQPAALTLTPDGIVLVSVAERGVVVGWPPPPDASSGIEVSASGGGTIVGIALAKHGTFVLERVKGGHVGRVLLCCGGPEHYEDTILDGVDSPGGLALLTDDRLAILSGGRVLLYRPDTPSWAG